MNHPFYHLLWKSYRSQRGIWFAMLGGMLLMQLLAVANTGQENPSTIALMMTILIAPTYMCVSTLLMFVMEEEQGTSLWLRLLPIKWWHQIGAGLLCSVGLTAALVAIGFSVAIVNNAIYQSQLDSRFIHETITTCSLAILPVWLVGLAVSSIFRRVLIVLPVITFFAVTNGISVFEHRTTWPAILASITALCALPFLVRRWQLGRPWSIPWTKQPMAVLEDAVFTTSIDKSPLRTRLLKQLAAADGLERRTVLMLSWQELRQVIPFGLVMLCIGLASVTYHHATAFPFPVAPLWLMAFTLECGLRTFRHDQQKQHGLFWAHRGISPTKVWIIKNSAWFPMLLIVSAAALWLDETFSFFLGSETAQAQYGLSGLMTSFANPNPLAARFQSDTVELINGSRTTATHALIAMLATGYFVAQLCSAWLRPPFAAGFIALMIFFGLPQWIIFSQLQDVPMTFSAWPIAVFCALATVCTSRSWMDRRHDGRIWMKRIVVVCLLPVGLWLGHQYYRRTQIPNGYRNLIFGTADFARAPTGDFVENNLPTLKENSTTDALWLELLLERNQISSRPCSQIIGEIQSTPDWDQSLLPIEVRISWLASIAPIVDLEITAEAYGLVRNRKAGEALQLLLKGVKLTEYLARQTTDWAELERCMNFLRNLHQHIHWCSSSDQVTAKDLQKTVAQFDALEHYSGSVASMLQNRQAAFLQLLQPDSDLAKQFTERPSVTFAGRKSWPKEFMNLSYTDRARHQALLNATTKSIGLEVAYSGKFPLILPSRWQHQFSRWAESTPAFGFERDPMLIPVNSVFAATGPMVLIDAAVNSRKATWWILQMQLYRREFGRMPNEAELRGWLKKNGHEAQIRLFIDWTTNEPFDFRLQGSGVTTQSQVGSQKLELHPQQPLIGGAGNLSPLSEEESARQDDIIIPLNRDRIVYLERSARIYPQPPVNGELAELIRNPAAPRHDQKDQTSPDQTSDK